MATHKIWKDLIRNLGEIHGERRSSPDDLCELCQLVDAIEAKWLTFTLVMDETKPGPPPNRETQDGNTHAH